MRRQIFLNGYYHIYNRGNDKQPIFLEERDWSRFLFLVIYLQSPLNFPQIGRCVSTFVKPRGFDIAQEVVDEILEKRYVELIAFSLMPNHFHLKLKEIVEGGIADYMGRIQNSYTKYFNTKYERSGHLFQGPYQSVQIESNEQMLHLSVYTHKNCRKLKGWKNREHLYPWSSYCDYLENRWGDLLKHEIVTSQFKTKNDYKKYIKDSVIKESKDLLSNPGGLTKQ